MFEISLVPEVKAKLLHQERIRNLVIFACVIVAIACGVVVAGLITWNIALDTKSKSLSNDIKCRIDGSGKKCKSSTSIMSTANLNETLSIQNELNNIGVLNANKTKPSRLLPTNDQLKADTTIQAFSLFEIILPNDADYYFQTSELQADFEENTLNYDIIGHALKSNASGTAYKNYKYSLNGSYFDYGDYVRTDKDGNVVAIPTYCIKEEKIIDGQIYGLYTRYAKGCETPMADVKTSSDNEEETESEPQVYHELDEIYIRRSYASSEDFEKYKTGGNRSKNSNVISEGEAPEGFYFQSACMAWDAEGKFDEETTHNNCPVATEEVEGLDQAEGKDETTGDKVYTFSISLPFSKEIFSQSSHNVMFFYPSRKTISTSYRAVEDFFTDPVENSKPVEEDK